MSVNKTNTGYIIDFTVNGNRYRERIHAPNNKTALKRIQDIESNYKFAIKSNDRSFLEKYPNSGILKKAFEAEANNFSVDQYHRIWFGRYFNDWSHTTIRGYNQKYKTHIAPNFGQLKMTDFTASTYHDWAKNQTMSGKSMNEIRNILNQIFKEAFFDGVIDVNPIQRTRPSKSIQKEPEPFKKTEIRAILNALSSPYKEYFQIAFYTGLRTGELIALRWEDVDFCKNKIHVRKSISHGLEKEPKTKSSSRNMDMHELAKEAFEQLSKNVNKHSHRVFIDPKTETTYKNAEGIRKYIWKPALELAQVKYRCPYQTRHTYASMMLTEGKQPMWVAYQMGHSDWGMIRTVYGRWIIN
jgi:integrase